MAVIIILGNIRLHEIDAGQQLTILVIFSQIQASTSDIFLRIADSPI